MILCKSFPLLLISTSEISSCVSSVAPGLHALGHTLTFCAPVSSVHVALMLFHRSSLRSAVADTESATFLAKQQAMNSNMAVTSQEPASSGVMGISTVVESLRVQKAEMAGASVAVAIVLAVYIPPHAPGPGQALRTMSALSSGSNSNFIRH